MPRDLFREVTKDEFFATVGTMNVHPRSEPEASFWETPNRVLMGKTTPGYRDGGDPNISKRYFVTEQASAPLAKARGDS